MPNILIRKLRENTPFRRFSTLGFLEMFGDIKEIAFRGAVSSWGRHFFIVVFYVAKHFKKISTEKENKK